MGAWHAAVTKGLSGAVSPLTSNHIPRIVQHDSTDCNQFECAAEQGLSVPRNEVNGVYGESTENLTNANREEILHSDRVRTGATQNEFQSADAPRRPTRSAARPSRFRDDQFETQFRPGSKNKVRQMHLNPGKGESSAVQDLPQFQREQPHVKKKARERQRCQTLGKGEPNGSKLGNSKQIRLAKSSLIQFPIGNQPYLIRKNGSRLGWPTWPKIRFKSHIQKFQFRTLSRRSIRFKPSTGSCKLSRGAFRVRMLN